MHEAILNSLFASVEVEGRRQQIQHLRSLIPAMKSLHATYQTSGVVDTKYKSEARQACYMLRYFPPYAELFGQVLKPGVALGLADTVQRAMFFGVGPAPEVLGFFKWLAPRRPRISARPKLNIYLLDIASDDWAFARDICLTDLVPEVWPNEVNYLPRNFDYCAKWEDARFASRFGDTQLFVFQNCFNEVSAASHQTVKANLRWLEKVMPIGSILVIIDRDHYSNVAELLKWVRGRSAYGRLECVVGRDEAFRFNAVPLINSIPTIITEDAELLIDSKGGFVSKPGSSGLFLQRKIDYHAVVMKKISN